MAADDWPTYRTVRLAMLRESPAAFGGTYDEAASGDEQVWRRRLSDNAVFLARVGQTPAGSATYAGQGAADPADCALFGMWVDPRFRALGVGRALLRCVLAQARAEGKRRVVLRVVSDNDGARALYQQEGFVATGRSVPYPHDARLAEVEMGCVVQESTAPPLPGEPG
jgi:ribosomal protein S18 acetylase RimI-like enzyme